MDTLMRILAPRSIFGFVVRLVFWIALIAVANFSFDRLFNIHGTFRASYDLAHAVIVGGPFISFFMGVTVLQLRLQRRLWGLSRKDGLTELNNRRTFFEMVEKARTPRNCGMLLMLDADRFKTINDTYGHLAGDHCLKSVAYTLLRSVREGDILGRLGGEEFAIYLKNASVETASVIGERLTKPITFETETRDCLSVTLSIGATRAPPEMSIDALIAQADEALYHAKQTGRARYVLWTPGLQTSEMGKTA